MDQLSENLEDKNEKKAEKEEKEEEINDDDEKEKDLKQEKTPFSSKVSYIIRRNFILLNIYI